VETSTPVLALQGAEDPVQQGGIELARSLGKLGVPTFGIFTSRKTAAARSRYYVRVKHWRLARHAAGESIAFLEAFASEVRRPAVLVALDDVAAAFVDANAERLSATFIFARLPVGLHDRLTDKRKLSELCGRLGVPSPAIRPIGSRDELLETAGTIDYPVVLKSIDPVARRENPNARSVTVIRSPEHLIESFDSMNSSVFGNLMLQDHVPSGTSGAWLFNGYFDDASRSLFGMTGRKLRQSPPDSGAATLAMSVDHPALLEVATRFLSGLGYRGVADLDFHYDPRDQTYQLLDVNPRLGASFRTFVDTNGLDVARAMYLDLTGQPVSMAPSRHGRKWIVEQRDLSAALALRRAGHLSLARWLASLRGVQEMTWVAFDDPVPFVAMSAHYLGRFGNRTRARVRRLASRLRVRR
jgi:D-aspartate ligase